MFKTLQMTPHDWDLLTKVIVLLKPFYITTKAAEGDRVSVSEVIPNIKKLDYEIRSMSLSGLGTLKATLLSEMERYSLKFVICMNYDLPYRLLLKLITL